MKKKIVVLTGAGMSAESGLSTFRDADGLWENYPVQQVASHGGWLQDPELVNNFYNMLRRQLVKAQPCEGHKLVAGLEKDYDVTVVTQNVDDLHERAGSTKVIHLHGELMKMCSSRDVDDESQHITLTAQEPEIAYGQKAKDGSTLRPFIVFFGEGVPKISEAAVAVAEADTLIIIGTSLVVYPAAGLIGYARRDTPIWLIDPKPVHTGVSRVKQITKGASEGMRELVERL